MKKEKMLAKEHQERLSKLSLSLLGSILNSLKDCLQCGQPFVRQATAQMYCSTLCSKRHRDAVKKASTPPTVAVCLRCDARFIKRGNKIFCSKLCAHRNMQATPEYKEKACKTTATWRERLRAEGLLQKYDRIQGQRSRERIKARKARAA